MYSWMKLIMFVYFAIFYQMGFSEESIGLTGINQTLSMNFHNIDIQSVIELLAKSAKVDLVIDGSVTGKISLELNHVTWDKAFNTIISAAELSVLKKDNVWIVGTTEEILHKKINGLKAKQQLFDVEPIMHKRIRLKYINTITLMELLKKQNNNLFSKRGKLVSDEYSNSIWLEDIEERLNALSDLIEMFDQPIQQVMISVRIVNVDKNYERDLGIQWHLEAFDKNNKLKFELPAALEPFNGVASFGLALAKLGNHRILDLELAALETQGNAKIIATPQILTENYKEALIQAGEEIPFQHAMRSGATAVSFKKALLSMHVTPQITPDSRIILKISVTQDKRGSEVLQNGPAIDTRAIETEVLVNDDQTIVLGGIYQQVDGIVYKRLPFLGDIPGLKYLLQFHEKITQQRELLIFVTTKIQHNRNR